MRGQAAERHVQQRATAFTGEGLQDLDLVEHLVGQFVLAPGQPRPVRWLFVPEVLAGEDAVREGKVRQNADAVLLRGRDEFDLDTAFQQVVMVLSRNEARCTGRARGPLGVGDLPGREVRRTHVADLALAHYLVESGQRLLDRGERVRAVELEKIYVVGLQPAKRTFHGFADVPARSTGIEVGSVHPTHVVTELGGEDHLVAPGPQDMAEQGLRTALVAICVRRVE